MCKTCVTPIVPANLLPDKVMIDGDEFDTVTDFCYLGDTLGQAGGCADAETARIRSAWKSFHELLPMLTNCGIYLRRRGNMFEKCVRTVLLYGSETWPLSHDDLCLQSRPCHD